MKEWMVDTNVLVDVIGADPVFGERSRAALAECAETGVLVINPVVYAEVSALVPSREEVDALLPRELFRRDPIPWEAAFLAGRAYRAYRDRGGARTRILADFLIGAHAAVRGFGMISRDAGHATSFTVEWIDPASAPRPDPAS
jgi:predicted nucleic acid-binding protein